MSMFKPTNGETWVQWFLLPHVQDMHLRYLIERLGSENAAHAARDQQSFAAVHWFNQLDTAKGADKKLAGKNLSRFMVWIEAQEKHTNSML